MVKDLTLNKIYPVETNIQKRAKMNPITNMRNLNKMNDRELEMGLAGTPQSWHHEYKDSAWIFVGGLPYDLTEGDIICVFSQSGEIVHINLVRDLGTGKVCINQIN